MEWQIRRLSFSDVKKQLHPVDLKALPSEHAQVTWPKLKGNFKLSPSEIPDQLHQTDHTFDAVFLRDSCSCERCVDPSTTQKTFDSADIPRNTRPKSLESQNDGTVRIVWEPEVPGFEGHVSMYGPSFGCMNRSLQSRLAATSNILDGSTLWDSRCMSEHHLTVDYTDYMSSSSILLSSLRHLFRFGLLFLRAVPSNTDAVSHIAKRIGPVKETLYGSTWDVRSVPSAKNVAYTSSHLGFHMVSRDRGNPIIAPLITSTGSALRRQPSGPADFALPQIQHEGGRKPLQ